MSDMPFVSCVMPTYNRRQFVPRAIEYFLRQKYPHKELVILDDGEDCIKDLVPDNPEIRYFREPKGRILGAKRNRLCELAQGDIIAHWDDDDWMAPHRISYQVQSLIEKQAEICGLRQMLFHDFLKGNTWMYQYPRLQHPWLAGGSLMYRKEFWRNAPFPNIQIGEDTRFIWQKSPNRAAVLSDYSFYVAIIHKGNTSPKICQGSYWKLWSGDLRLIMGNDLNFYQSYTNKSGIDRTYRMKLNLGCCDAPLNGFINIDIVPGPGVDVVDLREPWPWTENSIDYIRAADIIEHLPEKIFTMNEIWRVLKPNGMVEILVPTTDGPGAWQDPTHVSFWNRRSFLYYEDGNPYRERFARHYGIKAKFKVIGDNIDQTQDGPRLSIVLGAVKP